jgi:hypothetical protein
MPERDRTHTWLHSPLHPPTPTPCRGWASPPEGPWYVGGMRMHAAGRPVGANNKAPAVPGCRHEAPGQPTPHANQPAENGTTQLPWAGSRTGKGGLGRRGGQTLRGRAAPGSSFCTPPPGRPTWGALPHYYASTYVYMPAGLPACLPACRRRGGAGGGGGGGPGGGVCRLRNATDD